MLNVDEDNYKEAVESSYKVSVTPGISKLIVIYAFMNVTLTWCLFYLVPFRKVRLPLCSKYLMKL
jgi:hypothetical protein